MARMRVRVSRQNVTDRELAKALTGLIVGEGIERDVLETLQKTSHGKHEEIPELYIKGIDARMQEDFRDLCAAMYRNVDKWVDYQATRKMKKSFLRKADDEQKPVISQQQMDELSQLIESHFRTSIGITLGVPDSVLKMWKAAGIEMPDTDLLQWIQLSYVAGRMSEILKNTSTYAEMVKKAKKLPLTRLDQLAIMAAKDHCATFVKGYALRSTTIAGNVMLQHNMRLINGVMQNYFTGDLRQTKRNDEGLTPEEIESLYTDKEVKGWRELATELKNQFKVQDAGRDWDRIARTEIRYATNLGRLNEIQIEGGGDPDDIELFFHVDPNACRYCKELYLNPDGTPKIFKLSDILHNVSRTGGMQGNLKASRIGEDGGWVPNATCHPNGHCYPVRIIPGYTMPEMIQKGGE